QHALLLKVEQRLWTVAQDIGLNPAGAEFLLDARRLAPRTQINMANIQKWVFFFGGFAEVLEVAHRHGGIENNFAAFFLHLIDQFRRLSPRERRKKDRRQQ